ncbi:MAG: NADH-quinone oxidoreductase subunit J [Pseudomonadota bacterium]|mgnify:CR=1 FL=1
MMIPDVIFYIFATALVLASLMVVVVRNPVHAALYLILAFFTSACIWILLEAEFLALTLVLVYVGAVMVLFLFVVMMLDINLAPLREGYVKALPVGLGVAAVMFAELALILGPNRFGLQTTPAPSAHDPGYSNTKELGRILYTQYVYPFEIAAVILLVAIVAAIALTMRARRQTKYVRPEMQVNVKREDRLRIVKVDSERRWR